MTAAPAWRMSPLPDFLAETSVRAVLAALPEARIVGGAVRDALAGRAVADIDFATPRPPADVVAALHEAGLKSAPTGLDHGTVTAIAEHRGFEVTTLRRDVATDGRHAVVAFTDDFAADAARRDFTINAMSMTRDGDVFDYFTGIADLRAGRVRFVGDAATRIAEDYLRVLRFFRFHARYGTGEPDAAALAAVRAGLPGLSRLSAERVWSELKRILAAADPRESVALMQQTGALAAVLPEGAAPARLARLVEVGAPADPILRLAALLDGDAADLAERLRLSSAEAALLAALRYAPGLRGDATDDDVRRALADVPREVLAGRIWLADGDAGLLVRVAAMPAPVFPLQGRDLKAAGVPPGPELGALLRALRDWWLAGGCVAGAAAVRAEAARRVALRPPR
jgi:poly(A) polymerase/tRNA nucleotidyltransferase (CCA-adding enzyme)